MKTSLKLTHLGQGVENSLVVHSEPTSSLVYVSIQNNKHITSSPKVCLVAKQQDLDKFIFRIKKELTSHSTPELRNVATLYCASYCEILRVVKVDNDTFDVMMYYNYKRPRTKRCADYVCLTAVDLEKFIGGKN